MKKYLITALLLPLFANPGWCTLISDSNADLFDGTDVGSLDTLLIASEISGKSNPKNETDWVNDYLSTNLSTTVTFSVKDENVTYFNTDQIGIYAFHMAPPESEYFLIKNSTFRALFANQANKDWGVFNATQLPSGMNLPSGEFEISHVTRFDAASTHAPEPATMLLFGTGLAGLAGVARRRKKVS